MNDIELKEQFKRIQRAESDKQKHLQRLEQMKEQLVSDDVNIYNEKARLIEKICEAKKITLEMLCEYIIRQDLSHITGNNSVQPIGPTRTARAVVEKKEGNDNE